MVMGVLTLTALEATSDISFVKSEAQKTYHSLSKHMPVNIDEAYR
jgi:hypothetical protein